MGRDSRENLAGHELGRKRTQGKWERVELQEGKAEPDKKRICGTK